MKHAGALLLAATMALTLALTLTAATAHAGDEEAKQALQKAIDSELAKLAKDDETKPPPAGESEAKKRIRAILKGPDFSPEETYSIPSLKKSPDDKVRKTPEWMLWLEKFFQGLAEFLRVGVWVLVGIGVLLILALLHYWWRSFDRRARPIEPDAPVRVAGLDIRAESLPDDVGAAAQELLRKGEIIGALSLLYRGALSALVLRFDARIRASFTEQECARAARRVMAAPGAEYFQSLTRAWVYAVYAKRIPDREAASTLADAFATHFPRPAAETGART